VSDVTGSELRALMARVPSVEKVMASAEFAALQSEFGRTQVLNALRHALDSWRASAQSGVASVSALDVAQLQISVEAALRRRNAARLRSVFNLTGTVLHTNLGRALLPDEAVHAVMKALTQPANLEFDLDTGKRGDRDDLIDDRRRSGDRGQQQCCSGVAHIVRAGVEERSDRVAWRTG
jgi:L-seryl-tRNA(Ser) seleniumtransferase